MIEAKVESIEDVKVIHVEGYLSADSDEVLDKAYRTASSGDGSKVVFSFCEDDHINSAGIGILIGLVMEAQGTSVGVRFVHPSPHFRKIFGIVGLAKYVDVYTSLEQALAGF